MKTLDDLLLLGAPRLYQVCDPVLPEELPLSTASGKEGKKKIKKPPLYAKRREGG